MFLKGIHFCPMYFTVLHCSQLILQLFFGTNSVLPNLLFYGQLEYLATKTIELRY